MQNHFKVGRITVAVGLVGFGLALLLDNLGVYSGALNLIVRFWPLLLIGYGLEYLAQTIIIHQSGEDRRIRWDVGGAFLLAIIVAVSLGINAFHGIVGPSGHWSLNVGPSESRSETKVAQVGNAKQLTADVSVGNVSLRPATTPGEVRVEATYTISGLLVDREQYRNQLDAMQLNISEGDVIRITTTGPNSLNNVGVSYVIYAPDGLQIKARTGAGRIEVDGYKGDMELTSNVGQIQVENAAGALTANSGSGRIEVRDFEGPVSARTNVGTVDVRNVVGALQLDSRSGSIDVQDFHGGNLTAETGTGRINVETSIALEGNVSLKATTGEVALRIPKESSIRATAQTRTGSLNAPSFMTVSRSGVASSAVGTNGDGTYTVSLETSTGSVRLDTH